MPFNYDEAPPEVQEWFDDRPECVQKRILEYPPGEKYLMTSTGHACRLYAYSTDENDTVCDECQVLVLQEDNGGKLHMDRRVFGIKFTDLVPLPEGWEPTGDRPLEEMDPAIAEKVREVQRDKTH